MRRILVFSTLVLVAITVAQAQNEGGNISCSQRLRLARATYEAGRLHELVGTILGPQAQSCFAEGEGTFSKQEKVDALKLITLAYIYLEEPSKADDAMLRLLDTDHFYEVDEKADPAEYVALFRTFRTHPILSFGAKFGGTANFAHLIQNHPVGGQSIGNGKYKPGFSIVGGVFAERDLFPNLKDDAFLKRTVAMVEVIAHLRPNTWEYDKLWENLSTNTPSGKSSFKAKSSWVDMNFILKYRLTKESRIDPFVGVGPGITYLLNYSLDIPQTQPLTQDPDVIFSTVTGPSVVIKDAYKKIGQTVTAMGGIKFRIGEFYINAEARYQFGLNNLVNNKNRTIPDLVYNYQVSINDYRFSNVVLNIGATIPKFVPKKKKKR